MTELNLDTELDEVEQGEMEEEEEVEEGEVEKMETVEEGEESVVNNLGTK